jgi:PAS domain S-box-containing protein
MTMKATAHSLIERRIQDLRDNTDFVTTLFEKLVGYAIVAADFDGNIIAYNEGARLIYGYTPEEVIGKRKLETFFTRDFCTSGKLQATISQMLKQGHFSFEEPKVKKNGRTFPARVLMTLTRDKHGKIVGLVEITQDLTESREAEKAIARAQQLEKELRHMERLCNEPATATAAAFGLKTVRQSSQELFNRMAARFAEIMELAIERKTYKVEHDISGELSGMADELGTCGASPRDVIEVYSAALKRKTMEAGQYRAQAYTEEGRVMVLELMGHLVSYYRTYSPGRAAARQTAAGKKEAPYAVR